jgi:hypothetical protein
MQELQFVRELAEIDSVAKRAGVDRSDWSMALEPGSLAFFDGVLSGISDGGSYYLKEDLIFELLSHARSRAGVSKVLRVGQHVRGLRLSVRTPRRPGAGGQELPPAGGRQLVAGASGRLRLKLRLRHRRQAPVLPSDFCMTNGARPPCPRTGAPRNPLPKNRGGGS